MNIIGNIVERYKKAVDQYYEDLNFPSKGGAVILIYLMVFLPVTTMFLMMAKSVNVIFLTLFIYCILGWGGYTLLYKPLKAYQDRYGSCNLGNEHKEKAELKSGLSKLW